MARRRVWLSFGAGVISVAGEILLAGGTIHSLARPALITALIGLMSIAVGICLVGSMGLGREGKGLWWVATIPMLLTIALVVVLVLESHFRAPSAS